MLGHFLPDQPTHEAPMIPYGAAPVNLTYGLVSPEEVDAQKEEYTKSLEDQQEQAKEALLQQAQRQKEYLRVQAEQQKAIASGRWDQRLREQELAAEKQYQAQVARLNEAARQLKVALEYQVAQLLVEYDSRRTQEELNYRRYESELREWEECQHMSLTQIQHEEERLEAQRRLAIEQDTASLRKVTGLPEVPFDRWIQTSQQQQPQQSPYQVDPLLHGCSGSQLEQQQQLQLQRQRPSFHSASSYVGVAAGGGGGGPRALANASPYPLAPTASVPPASAGCSALRSSALY